MEKLTLASPVMAVTGATDFRVESTYLKRTHPDAPAEIRVIYREVDGTGAFIPQGRSIICRYSDTEGADALLASLNTANLTTISLERRITQRCQADGKLGAGTISGTPQ
jgi:hypothetical protein